MIDFRSDNTGRAAPEILDAMVARQYRHRARLWRRRVDGAAAGPLRRAVRDPGAGLPGRHRHRRQRVVAGRDRARRWGHIYCSEAAHINTSEANAAGFLRRRAEARAGRRHPRPHRPGGAARDAGRASTPAAAASRQAGRRSTSRRRAISARSIGSTTSAPLPRPPRRTGSRCTWTARGSPTRWRGSAAARPR